MGLRSGACSHPNGVKVTGGLQKAGRRSHLLDAAAREDQTLRA